VTKGNGKLLNWGFCSYTQLNFAYFTIDNLFSKLKIFTNFTYYMNLKKYISKLKIRWNITNNFQIFIVLAVFATTGFSSLFVHKYINSILGINQNTSVWLNILIFILLILPIFTALLYIWGTFFGQRKFFTEFIKFKISLIYRWKRQNNEH